MHFSVGVMKTDTFQTKILTANVERLTLFTFAHCIVDLAFNHAVMIFPGYVWNHLQMHRLKINESNESIPRMLKTKSTFAMNMKAFRAKSNVWFAFSQAYFEGMNASNELENVTNWNGKCLGSKTTHRSFEVCSLPLCYPTKPLHKFLRVYGLKVSKVIFHHAWKACWSKVNGKESKVTFICSSTAFMKTFRLGF